MKLQGISRPSLEFLLEPTLLLRRHGEILDVNAAARRLVGTDIDGLNLFDRVDSSHDDLDGYLRRSSGSTSPVVGAATLKTEDGPVRFRLHCAALPDGAMRGVLVLRCLSSRDDQFSLLGKRVRELNAQLRNRMRENAVLEEALRQNQALLKELQHRVKNNVQMMGSLIQMSTKGRQSDEIAELVEGARLRLQAMASTQDAIYISNQSGTVAAGTLLDELVTSIGQSFGVSANLRLELADAKLSNDRAHGLALIVNELTTNAIKHGLPDPGGTIRVNFGPVGEGCEYELVVHDSGPGIDSEDTGRFSGLSLVRALCRQIGAALEITNENGARCSVRFDADH